MLCLQAAVQAASRTAAFARTGVYERDVTTPDLGSGASLPFDAQQHELLMSMNGVGEAFAEAAATSGSGGAGGVLGAGMLAGLNLPLLQSRESSHNSTDSVQDLGIMGASLPPEGLILDTSLLNSNDKNNNNASAVKQEDLLTCDANGKVSLNLAAPCVTPVLALGKPLSAFTDAAAAAGENAADLAGLMVPNSVMHNNQLSTATLPYPAGPDAAGNNATPALLPSNALDLLGSGPLNNNAVAAAAAAVGILPESRSNSTQPTLDNLDLRQVAERAASFEPSLAGYSGVLEAAKAAQKELPAALLDALHQSCSQLDQAADEAAAADAAVIAVQKVRDPISGSDDEQFFKTYKVFCCAGCEWFTTHILMHHSCVLVSSASIPASFHVVADACRSSGEGS